MMQSQANFDEPDVESAVNKMKKQDLESLLKASCHQGKLCELVPALLDFKSPKSAGLGGTIIRQIAVLLNEGSLSDKDSSVSFVQGHIDQVRKTELGSLVEIVLGSPGGLCSTAGGDCTCGALVLLPNLLIQINSCGVEDLGGDVNGEQLVHLAIRRVTNAIWRPGQAINITRLCQDINMNAEQLHMVVTKVLSEFERTTVSEMPILMYHLLVLSSKGDRNTVLDGLIKYFGFLDSSLGSSNILDMADGEAEHHVQPQLRNKKALKNLEGTIMQHFSFTVKQDHALGAQFIRHTQKLDQPLTPFKVALLLSMADIQVS